MRRPLAPLALALLATLPLTACGGGDSGTAPASGGGAAAGGEAKPDAPEVPAMPKYEPSGIKEDYGRIKEAKQGVSTARKKDEKAAAEAALEKLTKETADKWAAKAPPAQECHYLAFIMEEAGRFPDALAAAKKYLDIATGTTSTMNIPHMTNMVIRCLAATGSLDEAEAEILKAEKTAFDGKPDVQQQATLFVATAAEKAGKLEQAARLYERSMTLGSGDPESASLATDCWQRLGKPAEAVRVAKLAAEGFPDEKTKKRMRHLVAACELVGKPAPGFDGARHWKGGGGPVTRDALKGGVTVVFAWNMAMKPDRTKKLFENLNALQGDYSERGISLVGISRLAKFDPAQGGTVADMTEEQELAFYDTWERSYGTQCAYAIGGLDDDALVDAWAAHLVPALIVVGKDGNVAYTRTGFEAEHFATVRQAIDKALSR